MASDTLVYVTLEKLSGIPLLTDRPSVVNEKDRSWIMRKCPLFLGTRPSELHVNFLNGDEENEPCILPCAFSDESFSATAKWSK